MSLNLSSAFLFPIFTKRFSDTIAKQLQACAGKYDVLYFDYSQVALYSLIIKHPFKVIRCHDIMAQRYYRKNKAIYPWVKKSEYKILKSANKVFVPSLKDKRILLDEYGIESEYTNEYISSYEIPENTQCDGFIMFGRWARGENLEGLNWFLDKVCPLLDSSILEKFTVMGGDMDEKTQKRVRHFDMKYIGFIDDAYGEIVKRKAMVVPLFRGAGVKVKVLDSFTVGTAVIGTDVAFEGIPEIDGLTVNACNETDFVEEIKKIDSCSVTMEDKRASQIVFVKDYDNRHISELL